MGHKLRETYVVLVPDDLFEKRPNTEHVSEDFANVFVRGANRWVLIFTKNFQNGTTRALKFGTVLDGNAESVQRVLEVEHKLPKLGEGRDLAGLPQDLN